MISKLEQELSDSISLQAKVREFPEKTSLDLLDQLAQPIAAEVMTKIVMLQEQQLAQFENEIVPITEKAAHEYLYLDRILGYAIKLRQLQGVMQQMLDCGREFTCEESQKIMRDAINNLELSSDKFVAALLTDVTSGTVRIVPYRSLQKSFTDIKHNAQLVSFIEQETITGYYAAKMKNFAFDFFVNEFVSTHDLSALNDTIPVPVNLKMMD